MLLSERSTFCCSASTGQAVRRCQRRSSMNYRRCSSCWPSTAVRSSCAVTSTSTSTSQAIHMPYAWQSCCCRLTAFSMSTNRLTQLATLSTSSSPQRLQESKTCASATCSLTTRWSVSTYSSTDQVQPPSTSLAELGDACHTTPLPLIWRRRSCAATWRPARTCLSVSYTHLTLPTILRV